MTGVFAYLVAGAWQVLFATGIPFLGRGTAETDAKFLKEMNAVMQSSSGVRQFGSAAGSAFVAAGRYDDFWERGLSLWDIAAGVLLVRGSGRPGV